MATEDFKRRPTAVLSADVAAYSRLMSEDRAFWTDDVIISGYVFTFLKKIK